MTPTPKKAYCFTLNNYSSEDVCRIRGVAQTLSSYAIFGREVGEQGTPHLQGYIRFARPYRFATVKDRYLSGCHVSVARGSARQNREYCSKSGDFEEFGELTDTSSERASRDELAVAFGTDARDGRRGIVRFAEEHPGTYAFSGHTLLRNFWSLQEPQPRPSCSCKWYYGRPGVGKSRRAHEELPGAYIKEPRTKWWNGYLGELEVIIDDFGPGGIDMNHLLRWFDKYKCYVENKGGMLPLCAVTFIVTSNFHPVDVYKDKEDVPHPQSDALVRRLEIIEMN